MEHAYRIIDNASAIALADWMLVSFLIGLLGGYLNGRAIYKQPTERSILLELKERLKGQREFAAENFNKDAANGAIVQIEETERFINEKLGLKKENT